MAGLKELRERAGLTQAEVTRRSGIAQPNIAAYEAGRRKPSPATERRLAAALQQAPGSALHAHRAEVIAILERYKMTNPRVFGSVAHGTDVPGSDIDLLVDAAADLDLLDIIDAATELEKLLGTNVDIVTSRSLRPGHEIAMSAVAM